MCFSNSCLWWGIRCHFQVLFLLHGHASSCRGGGSAGSAPHCNKNHTRSLDEHTPGKDIFQTNQSLQLYIAIYIYIAI